MRDHPNALMMFAAGFGTRMKHLTKDRPKPMVEVAGKPLVDHALTVARGAGCDPIVANLHYKPEGLSQHLSANGVVPVLETPDILDTGGGLRNALPHLGADPVFTMNTDAIWAGPNPLTLLRSAWEPVQMDGLLMTVSLANAVGHAGRGDFTIDPMGQLARGPGVVYGGVQIVKTEGLAKITQRVFSLNLHWDQMLTEGRLFGLQYPGKWCDVGHPDGVTLAEKLLEETDV